MNKRNEHIFGPSGSGRSLIGEAQEVLERDGFLVTSSLQRSLRLDYDTAAKVMETLKELGIISKSKENHTYVRVK